MAPDAFLLFLAAWTLLALSPGPAVMYVMSQTARNGMRGGVAATLGIVSGALPGHRAGQPRQRGDAPIAGNGNANGAGGKPHHGIALQGLAVQLTNPKNLLFVFALLPQFIRPGYPLLLQLGIMLTLTILIDGAFLLGYASLAARGSRALKGSRIMTWLERVFGAALIFFGLKLLASRR